LKKERQKSRTGIKPPDPSSATLAREGMIIAHRGVAVDVVWDDGQRGVVRVKRRSGHVVGDRVKVAGEVLEQLPRQTELRRRDAHGGIHLVGANLDVLGVVVAPMPLPPGFIDRAIVSARAADLQPFIIINKCDLAASAELVRSLSATYTGAVPVFSVSAATGSGLSPLREFLKGHRGAFVGTTGVGKSSLLNALCPEIDLKVGEINVEKDRGRHTTTVSTLHSLSTGGELIDTPGFQDFGLVDISAQELAVYFPGFEKTGEHSCRFRDCRHRTEPGCAVVGLVAKGEVQAERYETYLEILNEVEAGEAESRRREWKK